MLKKIIYTAAGIIVAGGIIYLSWLLLFSSRSDSPTLESSLGVSDTRTNIGVSSSTDSGSENTETAVPSQISTQKIFKIADGPISSAVFIEAKNPTTTLARYVLANNGHIVDMPIDVAGAVSKNVSNTTIPGIMRSLWSPQGGVALLQYVDTSAIKTVSVTLPPQSTSTVPLPAKLQFFPDGITEIALSPNGAQAAYLIHTGSGVDGYISKSDGSASKKTFSIPLSQVILAWPAQSVLLVESKSANGVPGIAFSVNAASGDVTPLLYADGLTAAANPAFSYLVYQSTSASSNQNSTYSHNLGTGAEKTLSFNPFPEKCAWGTATSSANLMYCASSLVPPSSNYLDLWHMGTVSSADSVFSFNLATGASTLVATPGSNQGGEPSDIASMAISPNGKYLLFIKKGDRSLWGMRLAQ